MKISIVTPSYNQAEFLDSTIRSVLDQDYEDLEYVIMDGGSTDGSVDIIKRYAHQLKWWESGPDDGQYSAIQKGFEHTTGEIMAWINSDDMFLPWTFTTVKEIFSTFPEVDWITSLIPITWNGDGVPVKCSPRRGYSRETFDRGFNLPDHGWHANYYVQQESTFWRRSLWERSGGAIETSFRLAGDYDLWGRFFENADLYGVAVPLGGFRRHAQQKTASQMDAYRREALRVMRQRSFRPCRSLETAMRNMLDVGASPGAAKLLGKLGLAYEAVNITYDLSSQSWTKSRGYII